MLHPFRYSTARAAIVACLLNLVACRSQSPTATGVEAIEQRYADIANHRPSLRHVERDLTDFSTEGGKMSAFLDGAKLRLIDATLYGETGQSHREFYYDDTGRTFFVLETESRYEKPFGPVARTREYRYYFEGGRLIRLVDDGRIVSVDDPDTDYTRRVSAVVQLSEQLRKEARLP